MAFTLTGLQTSKRHVSKVMVPKFSAIARTASVAKLESAIVKEIEPRLLPLAGPIRKPASENVPVQLLTDSL